MSSQRTVTCPMRLVVRSKSLNRSEDAYLAGWSVRPQLLREEADA
jgi:hypothetical protein